MALYIDYAFYMVLYCEITETDFERLAWDACRVLDNYTTGADGFKKLKHAFPVDPDDAETVERCAAKLVNILYRVEAAEKTADLGKGYTETEHGLQRKIVSRVESGSEAISYMESQGTQTAIDKALADPAAKRRLLADTVREYLSGVSDANGVNLLYMGVYPNV